VFHIRLSAEGFDEVEYPPRFRWGGGPPRVTAEAFEATCLDDQRFCECFKSFPSLLLVRKDFKVKRQLDGP
jgi:hypothetical protein